jgi:hypothetical protein
MPSSPPPPSSSPATGYRRACGIISECHEMPLNVVIDGMSPSELSDIADRPGCHSQLDTLILEPFFEHQLKEHLDYYRIDFSGQK